MIEKERPDISTNKYKQLLWYEKNYQKMQKENLQNIKENNKLKLELNEKCKIINTAIEFIQNHNKKAGALYYKYDNRYLLSEIKEELLVILIGEE